MVEPRVSLREEIAALGVEPALCRRVLVVDDQVENLDVLGIVLEEEWDVLLADSGAEALRVLEREGEVDVVISDQRMPGMTGVELLTKIAELQPDTIRMVLTAYSDVEPIVDAINLGRVWRFLLKPWDATEMRASVRDAMQTKADRSDLWRLVAALEQRREEFDETLREHTRAHAQLAAAERLGTLGRLTAGITHDLRNQLGVMMLLVDAVRGESDDAVLLHTADRAVETLRSLYYLVKDVNAFARNRPLALDASVVPTARFLSETARLLRFEHGFEPLDIAFECDDAPTMRIDVHRTRQAMMALIRNANDASASGSTITVRASTRGSAAVLEVIDEGIGMDNPTLERCREPFFSRFEGAHVGLGIGIAELVARSHGGVLDIESTPGVGTVARLTLGPKSDT